MKNRRGILACNEATYTRVLDVVKDVSLEEGFLSAT
jgi:hypothetical protein